MNLLRKHWFDIGGLLAVITLIYIFKAYPHQSSLQTILWLSLVSLFIHQLEEYRYPGYFPGMVNSAMYKSKLPERYPLNTQTSFVVNVPMGWLFYFLAALFADRYIWLGIGTMLVSFGNVIAHTVLFNLKGKTWYNPGMCTALILFLPLLYWFGYTLYAEHLGDTTHWIAGIALGIVLNVVGIVKLIDWMADRDTAYVFEQRQLRPEDRRPIQQHNNL
jgi:hypothetical protein